MERARCESTGMPVEEAKQRGIIFAKKATDLWDEKLAQ